MRKGADAVPEPATPDNGTPDMNKRVILNIVMLTGVLILAAVTFYKPGIEPPADIAPLTDLDSNRVEHIRIVRSDGSVSLERRGDGWWVSGDMPIPADQTQVNRLLQLTSLKPERSYPDTELDPAKLDLEPPLATLHFDDTELQFGDTDPLDHLRYVRVGDRISLIPDSVQNILQGTRTQFASRKLLPNKDEIVGITLPDLKLSKPKDGTWLIEPEPERISADAAPKLVNAWTTTSALWVRPYKPSQNSKPVRIDFADGSHIDFELRQNDRETVLARPDLALEYNLTEVSAKELFELEQPEDEKPAASGPAPAEPKMAE